MALMKLNPYEIFPTSSKSVFEKGILTGNRRRAGTPKPPKNRSVTVAALFMGRLLKHALRRP